MMSMAAMRLINPWKVIQLRGQLCAAPSLTSDVTGACGREVAAFTAVRIDMDQGNKSACPLRVTADKTLGNYDSSAFGCIATKGAAAAHVEANCRFACFIGRRAAAPFNWP